MLQFHRCLPLICFFATTVSGCGIRSSEGVPRKYFGGQETTIASLPYHVQMEILDIYERWDLVCGAAVYKEDLVITVGHCAGVLMDSPERIRFYSASSKNRDGILHRAVKVKVHPKFDAVNIGSDNDIAVIKIDPPFEITCLTGPIELADKAPAVGETGVAGGWATGLTSDANPPRVFIRKANVTVIDLKECTEAYEQLTDTEVKFKDGDLCVSYPNESYEHRDSCIQESGSPFVINGKLVGLAGLDHSCDRYGTPGIYTNVAKFKSWIEKAAKELSKIK